MTTRFTMLPFGPATKIFVPLRLIERNTAFSIK